MRSDRAGAEKAEDRVYEPVTAAFAARDLVNSAKAAALSGAVELGLGQDVPLLVKYDLERGEKGFLQCY